MDIQTLFVLYHNSPAQSSPDIIQILSRKLMAEFNDKKIRVVCLAGKRPFLTSFTVSIKNPRKFSFIKKKLLREARVFSYLSQNLWLNYISIQWGEKLASLLKAAVVCWKMGNKTEERKKEKS